MDVIRHDAPGEKPVALIVEMQQRGFDQHGDVFALQPAGAEARIEFAVDLHCRIVLKAERLDHVPRQAVGEPERHELHRFGRIEVRQVAS
jgi:hypothetical protein